MVGTDDQWLLIAFAVVAAVAVGAGLFFAGKAWWFRSVRRALVHLISRREAILASRQALESVLLRLADEGDAALEAFAQNPESEDRRTLAEVAQRMQIAAEELDTKRMPKTVVPVAEGLADAAFVIFEEFSRVGESAHSEEVLDALAEIDLERVAAIFSAADARLKVACERYNLGEAAVYGGGLYI